MSEKNKTIMIVDDSDIDRTILKTILDDEYEIIEKNSGFAAINFFEANKQSLDALLLDISMPAVDGFEVLHFMKEKGIHNFPVFLITTEATMDNVAKASQYGVTEFIRKPFEKDYILKRIRMQVGMLPDSSLKKEDIQDIYKYIGALKTLYNHYLKNFGEDAGHYERISSLMQILLTDYAAFHDSPALNPDQINIISKAGYFCNIGHMIVPPESVSMNGMDMSGKDKSGKDKSGKDSYRSHTLAGAELIGMNDSEYCRYFTSICREICIHHHERYDGTGYPHKIIGEHNLIYSQMCRIADEFDTLFFPYQGHSGTQFMFVASVLNKDKGNVSKDVLSSLADCKDEILEYYQKIDRSRKN